MSLESFLGFEQGEGMSAAALEALREKMQVAAAQIAALKKQEQKQKKKEDELAKILLQFVKTSHKTELALLISRALEQNIPANFILAIVLLGNREIQEAVGRFLMLNPGANNQDNSEKSLVFFSGHDSSLPLKLKIEIDNWIKNMLSQAGETPEKLLKYAYKIEIVENEQKKSIKQILTHLLTFVLNDFLEQNKNPEPYGKLQEFSNFILQGILTKTAENIENRKLLN